ncbi:hypothetical protein ACC680_22325 [Rhizobium ruizarguesonis]
MSLFAFSPRRAHVFQPALHQHFSPGISAIAVGEFIGRLNVSTAEAVQASLIEGRWADRNEQSGIDCFWVGKLLQSMLCRKRLGEDDDRDWQTRWPTVGPKRRFAPDKGITRCCFSFVFMIAPARRNAVMRSCTFFDGVHGMRGWHFLQGSLW